MVREEQKLSTKNDLFKLDNYSTQWKELRPNIHRILGSLRQGYRNKGKRKKNSIPVGTCPLETKCAGEMAQWRKGAVTRAKVRSPFLDPHAGRENPRLPVVLCHPHAFFDMHAHVYTYVKPVSMLIP